MPADHSPELLNALAQTLYELAGNAEDLGANLSADPDVVREHHVELQSIDLLCQSLCQVADILASEDLASALANMRLEGLRQHLTSLYQNAAA